MEPVGAFSNVIVDCADAVALASFWSEVLGVRIASVEAQYVFLDPTVSGAPALSFQEVAEPKRGKNRVHVDLLVDDLEVAFGSVRRLGATLIQRGSVGATPLLVVADPEGNEFCLVQRSPIGGPPG